MAFPNHWGSPNTFLSLWQRKPSRIDVDQLCPTPDIYRCGSIRRCKLRSCHRRQGHVTRTILVIFLLGGFSGRFGGYGYGYGHGGIGVIGIILIILVVLVLMGRL